MLIIFWFSAAEEIDFDLDLREIQGQERLDEFCGLLRSVGRHLGKPVLMDSEMGNPAEHPVLGLPRPIGWLSSTHRRQCEAVGLVPHTLTGYQHYSD